MSARDDITAGLLAACKALLPYAESARVPGPAMSDPWGPPTGVIRRAKEAISRAEAVNVTVAPKVDVHSGPACLFNYCPYSPPCATGGCRHRAEGG